MQWTIEMWYYEQEEDDLNRLARTVLYMLLFIMFCYFQRGRMGGIQEFQSVVLNLENEEKMQDKEMESVTNFIRPYLHQFSIDSHGLNSYGKPLKRPFDRYQSRLEAINNGRDIRQIN